MSGSTPFSLLSFPREILTNNIFYQLPKRALISYGHSSRRSYQQVAEYIRTLCVQLYLLAPHTSPSEASSAQQKEICTPDPAKKVKSLLPHELAGAEKMTRVLQSVSTAWPLLTPQGSLNALTTQKRDPIEEAMQSSSLPLLETLLSNQIVREALPRDYRQKARAMQCNASVIKLLDPTDFSPEESTLLEAIRNAIPGKGANEAFEVPAMLSIESEKKVCAYLMRFGEIEAYVLTESGVRIKIKQEESEPPSEGWVTRQHWLKEESFKLTHPLDIPESFSAGQKEAIDRLYRALAYSTPNQAIGIEIPLNPLPLRTEILELCLKQGLFYAYSMGRAANFIILQKATDHVDPQWSVYQFRNRHIQLEELKFKKNNRIDLDPQLVASSNLTSAQQEEAKRIIADLNSRVHKPHFFLKTEITAAALAFLKSRGFIYDYEEAVRKAHWEVFRFQVYVKPEDQSASDPR